MIAGSVAGRIKIMVALQARPRKTVEDYLNLPEGTLAELIGGDIFVSPSPKLRHQRIVSNLHFAFRQFVDPRKLGLVVDSPMDVHLPSGDVVQPDLVYVAAARASILQDWIRGTPDLIVEVLSPESVARDRIVKRDLYERNAVAEYWIVDPEEGSVEVLCHVGNAFEPRGYYRGQELAVSTVLKGLSVPLATIFA